MPLLLYAQPYDISAEGFFFRSEEEYKNGASQTKNSAGALVEEFEIQFIDGSAFDYDLHRAWGLSQTNFISYINAANEWEEEDKIRFIIAIRECGFDFDKEADHPNDLNVDIYRIDCMRGLAVEFVEEGFFGEIPEHLVNYLNYDAIVQDLSVDYREAVIAGERLIYRCA